MRIIDRLADLYRSERHGLYTYALGILGDEAHAEDVIQDVFRQLCRTKGEPRDLRAFVYRCVRNRALDVLRRSDHGDNMPASIYAIDEKGPWDGVLSRELADRIDEAMRSLGSAEREVIVLYIHGEMTFRQIAETLDEPAGTVASRYRRAIEKLRTKLQRRAEP